MSAGGAEISIAQERRRLSQTYVYRLSPKNRKLHQGGHCKIHGTRFGMAINSYCGCFLVVSNGDRP